MIMSDRKKEDFKMMTTMIQAEVGMYFSAIRNNDDKVFIGQIVSLKNMGMKGKLVTIKVEDSSKYASVYLDECFDYAWSDFELPALPGR